MPKWKGECPACSAEWRRTEDERDGYIKLSDWTLECLDCGSIENVK